eukprot:COSAG02_NODE_12774_length_1497_cov_1.121602_1_plen_93_part_00
MAYTVGRGLTAAERQDIKEAFDLCADVPEGSDRGCAQALSRHGLSCAMMSLLGYKPATVREYRRHRHRLPFPAGLLAAPKVSCHAPSSFSLR